MTIIYTYTYIVTVGCSVSFNFLSLSSSCSEVLALGFDERFLRIWEYYLIFSAAGFKSRAFGDYQVCSMYISIYLCYFQTNASHMLHPDLKG